MTTIADEGEARPLAFRSFLTPHVVPGEAVYLASEQRVQVLDGRMAATLANLLDGTRSQRQIRAELATTADPERVDAMLRTLHERRLVGYADVEGDPATEAFFEVAGTDGAEAVRALRSTAVTVQRVGRVDTSAVSAALRRAGIATGGGLPVVLTDDYLRPELARINATALSERRPWLLARPTGTALWVGPLFVPGTSGCWQCLAFRLEANQQAFSYLRHRLQLTEPPARARVGLAVTEGLAAHLVALELARHLGGIAHEPAAVVEFDTLTMATRRHQLVRRPQCTACGDAALQAEIGTRPFVIRSRPKRFTADGGHRSSSPEQMLETYGVHQSPITGVVTALTPAHATPDGVRVYVAGQNLARQVGDLRSLRLGLRSLSAGKGKSDAQARASALGEGIERYCGVFRGDEARRQTSLVALGEAGIHPNDAMLFSRAQYETRRRQVTGDSVTSTFHTVPEPFDPEATMWWSPVWSLAEQRQRWLPTSYLYFNTPEQHRSAFADSNGNAAGTSPEDATLQGFFELVERDAVALWWYNRARRPAVDLDAFGDPYVDRLREVYADVHRELWALDLTSDLGIPAVGAFSRRVDKPTEDILIAFGAHFDPHIALTRALTELNQFVGPATPRGDGYLSTEPDQVRWWRSATLENQPYLVADPAAPASGPSRWPVVASDDLADDVERAVRIVSRHGMEVFVLDQTRPDIGLPVVKTIVPGLRHFWARFAPGRLYDVPVALGWQPAPTPESDLNPIPVFI